MSPVVYRIRLMVVTCIVLFMAMLDNLVVGVALPSIQASFHAEMSDLQWFLNAYTLAFAILLIPFSALGERFGRKRIFLAGVVVFTLGSLAAALSDSSMQLTLARALQGVGAAAIMPISLTLVNTAFPPEKRAAAIGIWSGISGLGLSIGPLVGGAIIEGAPWEVIFWINVPIGVLATLFGALWLKESRGERKPIDPLGILLLGAGLFGLVFGLVRGNDEGWGAFSVWGPIAGGLLALLAFYGWERGRKQPFVQFAHFRSGNYSAYLSAGFWLNAGIFGAIFLLTLFLQQAQGYSALGAGAREMVWTACTMIAAPLAGLAIGRFGSKRILLLGLFLQIAAMIGFALVIMNQGAVFPFGYMVPMMMAAGAGMGLSFTPLSHGLLSSVSEEAAGEASGLSNTARELGGVFGVAIGGLVFARGGAIASPDDFGDHLVPSLFVLSAMLAAAFLSVVLFAGREKRRAASERGARAASEPELRG
ncbi:MFS transporter [Cohnella lubricantis]|uniref:MFS transporter n=1 Tax=Cohnella lubricantis TaxID=2163172 RepID=A0A841TKP8_9BACL|nr:MFS transporter [Cohnella lubricantis]MBB6679091.1 MFS transporter [Cohnella lubricantis]MBP2119667.1 EmrB/QacA subfamily drug resistance transporter [Cohnella lubricantis]